MFWGLNDNVLIYERNSIIISFQSCGCVMLYSFLFLNLRGIHGPYAPEWRTAEVACRDSFWLHFSLKLINVKRKHISYFTVRAYTNIPYQTRETTKYLTTSHLEPVEMLLNWVSNLFLSQSRFSKDVWFWTIHCYLSKYFVFKINGRGIYIQFNLSQT
jgi:hypothetical protein